jgi:hypothetical protein
VRYEIEPPSDFLVYEVSKRAKQQGTHETQCGQHPACHTVPPRGESCRRVVTGGL